MKNTVKANLYVACMAILTASTASTFAGVENAEARTGSVDSVATLPSVFHMDEAEHVFIKVSLNGNPEVWMMLDTGTTPSAINATYAKSIGLVASAKPGTGIGAGTNPINITNTLIRSLQCGAVRESNVPFVTVEYARAGPDGRPIAGVLGFSFLRKHTLILDYPRRTAALSDEKLTSSAAIPFSLTNDIPTVPVAIKGRVISALLDTGGTYQILITPNTTRTLGLEADALQARQSSGVGYGGVQTLSIGPGPGFAVAGITRKSSNITYMPLPIGVDGALGTLLFKDLRLVIDYRSRLVSFSEEPFSKPPIDGTLVPETRSQ